MTRDELIEFTRNRFDSEPEYLWENSPNTFIFRHQSNRKWFAVVMNVKRGKLGLPGEGDVFILDVKCGPLLSGSYLGQPGVLPAWHMNKNHWLGALLDGTARDDTIRELLEISYDMTKLGGTFMERAIMKDPIFLAQKSAAATPDDLPVAQDLLDTLAAHRDGCVGMAANMIGISKRMIAFDNDGKYMVMFNPKIVKCSGPYEAEEGCLSLEGKRKTRRYRSIKVKYQNEAFQERQKTFTGWTAQIIQHEIDHCNGILI